MSHELHDAKSGQFVKKGSDPATTVEVQEDRMSPWRREAERLLGSIEAFAEIAQLGETLDIKKQASQMMDEATVALIIHVQVLKRP